MLGYDEPLDEKLKESHVPTEEPVSIKHLGRTVELLHGLNSLLDTSGHCSTETTLRQDWSKALLLIFLSELACKSVWSERDKEVKMTKK